MGLFDGILAALAARNQRAESLRRISAEVMNAVDDGVLTEAELHGLQHQLQEAGLSIQEIGQVRVAAYQHALAVAKADGRIDEREVEELNRLQHALGLTQQDLGTSPQELARLRLLSAITEGNLPVVEVSGVVLKKSEIAHWSEPARLIEERVVSRTYVGGSSGVSIRIMKGVSYRVGAQKGQLVTQTGMVIVASGELVVTNQRLIFHGDRKSFSLQYEKVLGLEAFYDGIKATDEKGKTRVLLFDPRQVDLVAAVLSQALSAAS